jgi:hypothetical protein
MAMKFYMTPGSCSTGIHILLETLELPFEAWVLNLPAADYLKPAYRPSTRAAPFTCRRWCRTRARR